MAKNKAVWGIDIGQSAVKALRCRAHAEPDMLIADAFDYIEYPKILSQPDADPPALIAEALTQFLSRNSVKGDRVAISVPGQNGLARFIKLPPVEAKKIPDIVKYEARQQIPFALEDVVWDFQQMAGGSEHDGFALETEVGLFAMKREQVFRVLKPFQEAGIEVDVVQLTPLALYNYVVFDQMKDLPPADQYDPENPPESVVVLAMGTDSTDLVVTNGYRVWQRSVPLGGNHFTKALTKELKLTFPKAEHLKRNASHAEDAKAVFQAMRPVFTDLVTEVQRSIGYFANIDKRAKIGRIVALGNAMKLPGLQRFLAQNLGMDVDRADTFRGLTGPGVVDAPAFKENISSFGVCYGLALQGLRDVRIKTNLVPPEIIQERLIRAKKPWTVGAAAALLVGLTVSFGGHWRAWSVVHPEVGGFKSAIAESDRVNSQATTYKTDFETAKADFIKTQEVGANLVHNVEGRVLWLGVLKAINASLPRDPAGAEIKEAAKKNEIQIEEIDCQKVDDLAVWFQGVQRWYRDPDAPAKAESSETETAAASAEADASMTTVDGTGVAGTDGAATIGPTGPGWVFQLVGHHYHNDPESVESDQGAEYVIETIVRNLHQAALDTSAGSVPVAELGIAYPLLVAPKRIDWNYEVPIPEAEWEAMLAAEQEAAEAEAAAEEAAAPPRGNRAGGASDDAAAEEQEAAGEEDADAGGAAGARPARGRAAADEETAPPRAGTRRTTGGVAGGRSTTGRPGAARPLRRPAGGAVGGFGGELGGGAEEIPMRVQPRFDFIVQFCWIENPVTETEGEEPALDDTGEPLAETARREEE